MIENKFNLIDEPWIPVIEGGVISLKKLFSEGKYKRISGTPIEKIALMKLLQAICQSACTPEDEDDWNRLGKDGLAKKCLEYLEIYRDRFYLYGEKPFLQSPNIKNDKRTKKHHSLAIIKIGVAQGNTTLWSKLQLEQPLLDAEKAVLLITMMGFALGGGKWDEGENKVFNPHTREEKSTPPPGVNLQNSLLHSFCFAEDIKQTLWLNLFSKKYFNENKYTQSTPPWEWKSMPEPFDTTDEMIINYSKSITGRLAPLSRFVVFEKNENGEDIIYTTQGILYPSFDCGDIDPSISIRLKKNNNEKDKEEKYECLISDPEKRPWRSLPAILGFLNNNSGYVSPLIKLVHSRIQNRMLDSISQIEIWCGGIKVSNNSGEQTHKLKDDFVESSICINTSWLNENWYVSFETKLKFLDTISEQLGVFISKYYESLITIPKRLNTILNGFIEKAKILFWEYCESILLELLEGSDSSKEEEFKKIKNMILNKTKEIFDAVCPKSTARQLEAWAKNYPKFN